MTTEFLFDATLPNQREGVIAARNIQQRETSSSLVDQGRRGETDLFEIFMDEASKRVYCGFIKKTGGLSVVVDGAIFRVECEIVGPLRVQRVK